MLRVVSSLVLAPLAIAAAYFGGLAFIAFWAVAALAVLWEWDTLVCAHDRNPVLATGAVALAGSALLLALDRPGIAIALIALGCFGVAALASKVRRMWCAAGLVYAAAILIAPVLLRRDASLGFAAILFLFVIVWLTDITAYFVGRAVGGPKLMPRVSPEQDLVGRDRRNRGGRGRRRYRGEPVRHRQILPRPLWWHSCFRSFRRRAISRNPRSSANSTPRMRASSFPATAA